MLPKTFALWILSRVKHLINQAYLNNPCRVEKVRIPPSYQQQTNHPAYHVGKRCRYSNPRCIILAG